MGLCFSSAFVRVCLDVYVYDLTMFQINLLLHLRYPLYSLHTYVSIVLNRNSKSMKKNAMHAMGKFPSLCLYFTLLLLLQNGQLYDDDSNGSSST